MFFRFEHASQPLVTWRRFFRRMAVYATAALAIDTAFLAVGAFGFHQLEPLDWMGAALNAGMILTGNGPIKPMHTAGGRLFQLCYAMLGGIVFVMVVSVLLAPVLHRILHAFHLDTRDQPSPPDA